MSKTPSQKYTRQLFQKGDSSFLFLFLVLVCSLGIVFFLVWFGKNSRMDISSEHRTSSPLEQKIATLVSGHPIEKMVPYIAASDVTVAAYLVAIAKKESNWGKFAPQKDGKTCHNYWGYRGPENTTDSGYSCFDSRGEAVATVGARLRELVEQGFDTSQELVVWKRGFLEGPLDASEEKWVSDVDFYAEKLLEETKE